MGSFDIDNNNYDGEMTLFDSTGSVLASSDDESPSDPGAGRFADRGLSLHGAGRLLHRCRGIPGHGGERRLDAGFRYAPSQRYLHTARVGPKPYLDGGNRRCLRGGTQRRRCHASAGQRSGWKFIEQAVNFVYNNTFNNAGGDILAIGADVNSGSADAIQSVADAALGLTVDYVNDAQIATINFNAYKLIYVPSNELNSFSGGIEGPELDTLAARRLDIRTFVRNGGGKYRAHRLGNTRDQRHSLRLVADSRPLHDHRLYVRRRSYALCKTQAAINAGLTISDGGTQRRHAVSQFLHRTGRLQRSRSVRL